VIDGGSDGNTWVYFGSAGHGVNVDLSNANTNRVYGYAQIADDGTGASSATGAQDLIKNVNNIQGTQYNDMIVGTDVTTGAFANSGKNTIRGGDGSDILDGAGGVDTYDASGGALGAIIDLTRAVEGAGAVNVDGVSVTGFINVTDSFGKTDYIKNFESVIGGQGNDSIKVSQTQLQAGSFDGGSGVDSLAVTGIGVFDLGSLLLNAGASRFSNIEYLKLSDGVSGTNFTATRATLTALYTANPDLVIQLDTGDKLTISDAGVSSNGVDAPLLTVSTPSGSHDVKVDFPGWQH